MEPRRSQGRAVDYQSEGMEALKWSTVIADLSHSDEKDLDSHLSEKPIRVRI